MTRRLAILKWLDGKKTYLAGAFAIAAGIGGAYLGFISHDAAVELVCSGLALFGVRSAFTKLIAAQAVDAVEGKGALAAPLAAPRGEPK